MANYSFTFKDDALEHHGIEGQKWGVRNGPPYPLDSGDHSKAELRAMRKDQKKNYKELRENRNGLVSVASGQRIQEKLTALKNQVPEIEEMRKINRTLEDLPRSKEGQKKLTELAKRDYQKAYQRSPDGRPDWERWLDTYLNEPDVYWSVLADDPNIKKMWSAWDNMMEQLRGVYQQSASEILGKYADKKVNGRRAADILAKSMEYYFLD